MAAPLLGRRPALLLRVFFLAVFLAFLVYATFFARWRPHSLDQVKADFLAFGPAGPFVAVLVQAFGIVLLIPGFLLVLATAIVFGYDAVWISLAGQTLGATLAYLIGRYVGRDPLHAILGQRLIAIERVLEDHAFRALLLMRLASVLPGPFLIYAPGLVRVPLRQVVVATLLGDLPFVLVLSFVGKRLGDVHRARDLLQAQFLVPFAILVLLFALPVVLLVSLRRRRSRA